MWLRDPTGIYAWIVAAECLCLAVLVNWKLLQNLRKQNTSHLQLLAHAFLGLTLLVLAINQLEGSGRPILSVGIAMPGSMITRWDGGLPAWVRRAVEPAHWALIFGLLLYAWRGPLSASAAALALIFTLCDEFKALLPEGQLKLDPGLRYMLELRHLILLQIGLVFVFLSFFNSSIKAKEPSTRARIISFFWVCCGFLYFIYPGFFTSPSVSTAPISLGAHYYTWFPENWVAGYLGEKLQPPVVPALGRYESNNPAVVQQHLDWAAEAGIDFFVVDWWPNKYHARKRANKFAAMIAEDKRVRFAIQYEAEDLKEKGEVAVPGEHGNIVYLSEARRERLSRHWVHVAKNFMQNPSYLRMGGNPVLFVYSTRHLVGPVLEAVWQARRAVWEETGLDMFIVADEAFPNVLDFSDSRGVYMLPALQPNWRRVSAFDALTAYNPYDPQAPSHAGISGAEQFFKDTRAFYDRYRSAARVAGMEFLPTVIPGYNDRGVRPNEKHYVLPRALPSERPEGFFEQGLQELVDPYLDRSNRIAIVTSWNEWNEATQVEPTMESPTTADDLSESGSEYSAGEASRGYGTRYLEILRAWKAKPR